MLFGVDLSANQSITDADALNAAIDFAYLRVFRSNGLQDSKWRSFHSQITKKRAPYIFLRPPSVQSWTSQFSTFWGWANDVEWEWGPVLDCEFSGLNAAEVRDAIAASQDITQIGVQQVYLGYSNLTGPIPPSSFIPVGNTDIRIIASRYFANNRTDAFANLGFDHPNLDITQYWDRGTAAGLSGAVDLNSGRRITTGGSMTTPDTPAQTRTNPNYGDGGPTTGTETLYQMIASFPGAISYVVGYVAAHDAHQQAFRADVDATLSAHTSALTALTNALQTLTANDTAIKNELDAAKTELDNVPTEFSQLQTAVLSALSAGGTDPAAQAAALAPLLGPELVAAIAQVHLTGTVDLGGTS